MGVIQLLSWRLATDMCSLCKLTWDRKEETEVQIMNLGKLRLWDRQLALREREGQLQEDGWQNYCG